MIRAFLAINLPAAYHAPLTELLQALQRSRADVKWVPVANIHLTLKFFGSITPAQKEAIVAALQPVAAASAGFILQGEQVGGFPNLKNPRVIWLGLGGQVAQLHSLYNAVVQALVPLGFPPEDRPFTPHLTLGRVRSGQGRQALQQALQELTLPPLPAFQVQELVLYQSTLRPQGAVYTPLTKLALGR